VLAEFGQHGGRLEPDIAATDDCDLVRVAKLVDHAVDVGAGADAVDSDQVVARASEPPRVATGRPDELAIDDLLAARGADKVRSRIDCGHLPAKQHGDLPLVPESGGADQDSLERLLASEIIFRQRRAFVGKFGLLADDGDGPGKAVLAERDRGLRAAVAAPTMRTSKLLKPSALLRASRAGRP